MPGGNPIDLSYARQLVKNFKENDLANGQIKTDDTEAVWFSTSLLLQALGVDPQSANPDITGLRFYFGAYGENVAGYPPDPADEGKLTLVVVQTGTDSILVDKNEEEEIVYLDIIDPDDEDVEPSYPEPNKPVVAKSTFDEGQCFPPPNTRLGL